MENAISVKYLDVLYYDKKLLPITLEIKDNKRYVRFLLNGAKIELNSINFNSNTVNKGATGKIVLKVANGELRHAEIGSLLNALFCYGTEIQDCFPNLHKARKIKLLNQVLFEKEKDQAIYEYFNIELTKNQIKALFDELNKAYQLQICYENIK